MKGFLAQLYKYIYISRNIPRNDNLLSLENWVPEGKNTMKIPASSTPSNWDES
jgi:hypothetical protein